MYLFKNNPSKALRIKICGLSQSEDVKQCSIIGVDAVGFLLGDAHGHRPTDKLTTQEASDLVTQVPESMVSVLLIRSVSEQEIDDLIDSIQPDTLQLQSQHILPETVRAVAQRYPKKEFLKTITIQQTDTVEDVWKRVLPFISFVDAILLDSEKGGSGVTHDWTISAEVARRLHSMQMPVILAGGLNPSNILKAIETVNPDMIDLMSGVSLDKGIKNIAAIQLLFETLKQHEL